MEGKKTKFTVTIEMEKPKSCEDCPFDYDEICCVAVMDEKETGKCKHHDCITYKEVESWCPLVEVNE